jgi:hypothetical protein
VIFGSSAFSGSPLENLVDHYLSDALIQAVAHEAASGRLLLVATTNVDAAFAGMLVPRVRSYRGFLWASRQPARSF